MSAASGGNSEPKQGQRSQSARGFCPRSTMRVPQPDIIEHFGNADAVPQLSERCLSRKARIVRCCLCVSVLQRSKTPYHKPYCRQLLFLFISFFRRVFQFLVAFFIHRNFRLHQRKGEHDRNNASHTSNSQAMGRKHHDHCGKHTTD